MRPLFFNQKMAANEPEKKIPSTQAKATSLTRKGFGRELGYLPRQTDKLTSSGVMYFKAQSAFFWIQGTRMNEHGARPCR